MSESGHIGKYATQSEIGSGGFATVYRATDTTLGRPVALKILHPQLLVDHIFVQRFFREARIAAGLRHPNIVTIHEIGQSDGRIYMAMELAAGGSLADMITRRGGLPWAEVIALVEQIAAALDYAHTQGVVHRDLKPANILIADDARPMISDFGFASAASESTPSTSASGDILGTPAYIAPELWDGAAATPAADIYALGCIVYELLTGQVLFAGTTTLQVVQAHAGGPQLPRRWPTGVPAGTSIVLKQALAKDPGQRYASAAIFAQALRALSGEQKPPRPAGRPNYRLMPGLVIGLCIGAFGLLLSGVTPFYPRISASPTATLTLATTLAPSQPPGPPTPTLETADPRQLSGSVLIAGSSALFNLTSDIAERFRAAGFTGDVTVDQIGTDQGFARLCEDKSADLAMASRPILAAEVQSCVDNGLKPFFISVGSYPLVVLVSPQNHFVDNLSMQQLTAIFSGTARRWRDVDPSYPDEPIQLLSTAREHYAYDLFARLVFAGDRAALDASGAELTPNDSALMKALADAPFAISFTDYVTYNGHSDLARAPSIDGAALSADAVESNAYPLAEPLLLYADQNALAARPEVKAFLQFSLRHLAEVATEQGYLPPSPQALNNASQALIRAIAAAPDTTPPQLTPGPSETLQPSGVGQIAFSSAEGQSPRDIYLIGVDGGLVRLTESPDDDQHPAWSPDGGTITFASNRDGDYEIYTMRADGSEQTRLTVSPDNDMAPAWSPDGKAIAFVSARDGQAGIYTMSADGGRVAKIFAGSSRDAIDCPSWSPNGDRIVFFWSVPRSEQAGVDAGIYTIKSDGTGLTRIANSGRDGCAVWGPGERIAFTSVRDGNYEIYLMNSDGSGVTRLTNNSAFDYVTGWSADGSQLFFESDRDGNSELYMMGADGGAQSRLTTSPAKDEWPAWWPGT